MKTSPLFSFAIVPLVITVLLLLLIHLVFVLKMEVHPMVKADWWFIHLFLGITTLSGVTVISNNHNKTQDVKSVGKTYLFYTTVKILLSLGFLAPWLILKEPGTKNFVMHFFAIFFPYLLVETILLIRYLNGPLDEKFKNDENQSGK